MHDVISALLYIIFASLLASKPQLVTYAFSLAAFSNELDQSDPIRSVRSKLIDTVCSKYSCTCIYILHVSTVIHVHGIPPLNSTTSSNVIAVASPTKASSSVKNNIQ